MKREKTTPSIPSLKQITPFDLLDDPCLHRLVAASRLVRADRGEILIQADEISHCVHVVLDGEVKCLLLAPAGNEKLIRIAGPARSSVKKPPCSDVRPWQWRKPHATPACCTCRLP